MKDFLGQVFRHWKRGFHGLLILMLIGILFSSGVFPFTQINANAKSNNGSKDSKKKITETAKIPFGKDVSSYDPYKDGYYAYLPVLFENPRGMVEVIKYETNVTESYVPVLCYQNYVYIKTDILEKITELWCEVNGSNITITWFFNTRRLKMTIGSSSATYQEGFLSTLQDPLVNLPVNLVSKPIKMGEDIYIPMDVVFRMFGMDPIEFENKYWFRQPQVNALDVLARLYDSTDREAEFSGKQYFITPNESEKTSSSAAFTDNFYDLATFDPDTWKMAFSKLFDDEAVNKKYYKQISTDLLSMDSETSEQLNAMALDGMDISLSVFATKIGYDVDSVDIPSLINALEDASESMPGNVFSKEISQLKRINNIQKKIKWANEYDKVGIGTDALFAFINNLSVYANADRIAVDGLGTVLSDDYKSGVALTDGERAVLKKEHDNYPKQRWMKSIVAYQESCDDVVVSMAQTFVDTFCAKGAFGWISLGLKVSKFVANSLGIRTVDNTEEYMKAYYAPFLIYRFGKGLYYSQTKEKCAKLSDDKLKEQISLAYLYLRMCRLEDEYIINSSVFDEDSVHTCQAHISVLDQLIAVLARDYTSDGALLPDTAFDRANTLSDSHRKNVLVNLAVPLYMCVYGTVYEKNEEKTPVSDVKCSISYEGEEIAGYSTTDERGDFVINIPVSKPVDILSSLDDLNDQQKRLSLLFSSDTVDGTGSIKVPFKAGVTYDAGDIYLEQKGAYEAYLEIVEKCIEEYGETGYDEDKKGRWPHFTGLSFLKLFDFNKDGTDELIIVYYDKTKKFYYGQIWGFNGKKAVLLQERDVLNIFNQGGTYLELLKNQFGTFLYSGYNGNGHWNSCYFGFFGTEWGNKSFQMHQQCNSTTQEVEPLYFIDDKQVTSEELIEESTRWKSDEYEIYHLTNAPEERSTISKIIDDNLKFLRENGRR